MKVLIFLPEREHKRNGIDLGCLAHTVGLGSLVAQDIETLQVEAARLKSLQTYFLLVTHAAHVASANEIYQKNPFARCIVLCSEAFSESHALLAAAPDFNHFLPFADGVFEARMVMISMQRLARREYWGLGEYLGKPALHTSALITSNHGRDEMIAQIRGHLTTLGSGLNVATFERYIPRVTSVLEELVINAVFAANPRYAGNDGEMGFTLPLDEAVSVEWGFNGKTLGLSVSDPFGSLKRDVFFSKFLADAKPIQAQTKALTLGNGLRTILKNAHSVIANVSVGARTSVHVFLDFEPSLKTAEDKPKQIEYHFC